MIKISNECMCECHNNINVKHCFPCCTICTFCGKGFIDIKTHREECIRIKLISILNDVKNKRGISDFSVNILKESKDNEFIAEIIFKPVLPVKEKEWIELKFIKY